MEPETIDDSLVDKIRITPSGSESGSAHPGIEIEGPPETLVLTSTLGFFGWSVLPYIASSVRNERGRAIDETGFRYPTDELDPDEEPFEGVNVYNPLGDVYVSVPAFERLMSRYFGALVKSAEAHHAPVTEQSWWPEFMGNARAIESRVKHQDREKGEHAD